MRQKLFSILALLLVAATGAWAQTKTLAEATAEDIGKVVCADGHLHDAKTAVPDGCTAVGIVGKVTETGYGLILALQDANSQKWTTINGWGSVDTYAGTTLKLLPATARGSLTGYKKLGETAVSNWAVAQKSDYVAIFTNLGSTTGDSDGHTYDSNVNDYITTGVGGTAMSGNYISATIYSDPFTWEISSENWGLTDKNYTRNVRPVLGFGGEVPPTIDLSMVDNAGTAREKQWTANCYMVHTAGDYKLPLVYGNAIKEGAANTAAYTGVSGQLETFPNHAGNAINAPWITKSTSGEGVDKGMGITVASAELLWQDALGLITEVGIDGDYLTLTVGKNAAAQQGNAVVAAKTSDGTIVWSWHIWVTTETFADATLTTVATGSHDYQVTPVNLGWVPTGGAGKQGYNTFYQWGRKDAFIPSTGSATTNHTVYNISGSAVTGITNAANTTATIADNIKNPTTRYHNSNTNGPCNTAYNNMWDARQTGTDNITTATVKTVYDPCPAGFCVPTGNLYYFMGNSGNNRSMTTWDATNKGGTWDNTIVANSITGNALFFPASGFRHYSNGNLTNVGAAGMYWSASARSSNYLGGYLMCRNQTVGWGYSTYQRAGNFSVRAVAEIATAAALQSLNDAIAEAEAYYNSIKDTNPEVAAALLQALNDAKAALLEAINAAKAVKAYDYATQVQVDAAIAALVNTKATAEQIIEYIEYTVTLDDVTNNQTWLDEADGKVYNVTLTRTLQTGGYNTFAVPFAIGSSKLTELGITAKKLTASEFNSSTGVLSLTFANATDIEAGKPYLVKVASAVENPTFEGVTVSSTTTPTETTAVDFVPTLGATDIASNGKNILILGASNTFYFAPAEASQMKGFRAYFLLRGGAAALARSFVLDFGDGQTTGIISLKADGTANYTEGIYTLDGRKLQSLPTKRGVYIVNGKKVIK